MKLKVLSGGAKKSSSGEDYYKNLITDNFEFIEKQCFKAIKLKLGNHSSTGNPINVENEALELNNHVLDTLQRDDYRALKEFKGNARITTYITAIISRLAVDMIRKKLGRSREKERAKEMGDTGMLVYQRAIKDGCSPAEVLKELQADLGYTGSQAELETMIQKIKGKNPVPPAANCSNGSGGSAVKTGTVVGENEYIIPDTRRDPQRIVMEDQRKNKIHQAVQSVITHLDGEERILLRMRFPPDDKEKPASTAQVSKILGISQKAVYKRITRLLKKCKDQLDREGVNIHDLL